MGSPSNSGRDFGLPKRRSAVPPTFWLSLQDPLAGPEVLPCQRDRIRQEAPSAHGRHRACLIDVSILTCLFDMGRAIALFCGISITFPSPVIFYELQSSTDVVRAGFQKKETKKKKRGEEKGEIGEEKEKK